MTLEIYILRPGFEQAQKCGDVTLFVCISVPFYKPEIYVVTAPGFVFKTYYLTVLKTYAPLYHLRHYIT